MRNQFFFSRKQPLPPKTNPQDSISSVPPVLEFITLRDSINMDKVVRTATLEDGKMMILLDDYHEMLQDIPMQNKQGKVTGWKKERNTVQSQVILEPEDAERFYKLTSIE